MSKRFVVAVDEAPTPEEDEGFPKLVVGPRRLVALA